MVIAVIGTLVGLLLPAVHSARRAVLCIPALLADWLNRGGDSFRGQPVLRVRQQCAPHD